MGVPREIFLFLDLFIFLILKLDLFKNIFRNWTFGRVAALFGHAKHSDMVRVWRGRTTL